MILHARKQRSTHADELNQLPIPHDARSGDCRTRYRCYERSASCRQLCLNLKLAQSYAPLSRQLSSAGFAQVIA